MAKRRELLAVGVAAMVLGLAAAQAGEPRHGGQLIVALNADIRGTDGIDRDSNTDTIMNHIAEGLVAHREDLSVGPLLAESWEVSDDGKVYSFSLRDGLRFHNGEAVTTEAVKWSWDRLLDPEANWRCAGYYNGERGARLESVEVVDERHVRFTLAEPNYLFLSYMANFQCLPGVLHPASVNADGSWSAPIATGPFKLAEWRPGEFIRLERFDGYRPRNEPVDGYAGGRVAYLDSIKLLITPEESVAKAALYAGDVDVLPGLGPSHVEEVRSKGMEVQVVDGLPWTALLVQTRDPLLADVRLRRAIAHALDIEQIAAAANDGLTGANPSAVPASSPFYGDIQRTWPEYSVEKAKALLAEAGYANQPIKVQTNKKYQGMYDNAVIVQAMLSAAGIKAELEVLDWATQLDNYYKMTYQLSSFGYSARLDPRVMYSTFVGSKDEGGWNQWESPQAIEWVDLAGATNDPAKLQEIYDKLHLAMADDVPIYGLYNSPTIDAVSPKVEGYKAWSTDKPRFWGVWKTE